jgi:hypothetical protein
LHIFIFTFFDKNIEGSGPNGSKHYQNSILFSFLPESNFDLLLSSSNI